MGAWMLGLMWLMGQRETPPLRVPLGRPAMIDGRLDPGEWSGAAQWEAPGLARFHIQQTEGCVWIAMELTGAENGTVDLYLATDAGLVNLHASAKLGERRLTEGAWPTWEWWNNRGWVANTSRFDAFEKAGPRRFLRETVREFQIRRDRFPGRRWRIMAEVMTEGPSGWTTRAHPAGAKNDAPAGWIELDLGG